MATELDRKKRCRECGPDRHDSRRRRGDETLIIPVPWRADSLPRRSFSEGWFSEAANPIFKQSVRTRRPRPSWTRSPETAGVVRRTRRQARAAIRIRGKLIFTHFGFQSQSPLPHRLVPNHVCRCRYRFSKTMPPAITVPFDTRA